MTHLDASENSKQVRSSDRRVTTTTRRLLHASRCQLPPLAGRFGSSGAARPVRARRLDIFARDALRLASRAGYPAMAPRRDDDARDFYKLKRIDFFGRRCAVVTQNENGPCPLIGIANVLLLRNTISLTGSEDRPETSTSELMSLIAARLLDTNADADDGSPDAPTKLALADAGDVARDRDDAETREALRQNQEQNISDAMAVLPTLATGLDVNVRFRHALDFEFTAELAVFDLLDVTLAHAWCVDPDDAPTARAIDARSYNQLMERLVQLATIAEDAEREERGGETRGRRRRRSRRRRGGGGGGGDRGGGGEGGGGDDDEDDGRELRDRNDRNDEGKRLGTGAVSRLGAGVVSRRRRRDRRDAAPEEFERGGTPSSRDGAVDGGVPRLEPRTFRDHHHHLRLHLRHLRLHPRNRRSLGGCRGARGD